MKTIAQMDVDLVRLRLAEDHMGYYAIVEMQDQFQSRPSLIVKGESAKNISEAVGKLWVGLEILKKNLAIAAYAGQQAARARGYEVHLVDDRFPPLPTFEEIQAEDPDFEVKE